MLRIAILGANGQVGAEVTILLARHAAIEVIPICRNPLGSSYIRSLGIKCRHGDPTDLNSCISLYGDCDVVANFALVSTSRSPRQARLDSNQIISNVGKVLGERGRHIYFSTMSVYGDRNVGELVGIAGSYGRDKSFCERIAIKSARKSQCLTTVLRLGHVYGELQGLTREIRQVVTENNVHIPDLERHSNITNVATIVDAILTASRSDDAGGVFDLMNVPQWTWREVLEHEASKLKTTLRTVQIVDTRTRFPFPLVRIVSRSAIKSISDNKTLMKLASRTLLYWPSSFYQQVQGKVRIENARREIAALAGSIAVPNTMPAFIRAPISVKPLPGLTETRLLMQRTGYTFPETDRSPVYAARN